MLWVRARVILVVVGLAIAAISLWSLLSSSPLPPSSGDAPNEPTPRRVPIPGTLPTKTPAEAESRNDSPPTKRERIEIRRSAQAAALIRQKLAADAAKVDTARDPDRRPPTGMPMLAQPGAEIKDRTGQNPQFVQALQMEILELIDECIAARKAREPQLRGMLAVGIELVGDRELGTVINTLEFPPPNAITDSELRSCVRETILSAILPATDDPSTDQLVLTIPID